MKKWMTALLLLLCTLPALQGQTREELRAEAEEGNAKAQYKLGSCHMFGKAFYADGVGNAPVDYNEAERWLLKAAAQGYRSAFYSLGMLYQNYKGNKQEAIRWYEEAIGKNCDLMAQQAVAHLSELGIDYLNNSSFAQTLEGLRLKAEMGDAEAQYKLAECYAWGKASPKGLSDETERNYDEAEKWFLKAAAQGYVNAYFDLGLLYQYDKPDKQKAIEYYQKHVEATGNKTSIKNLRELGVEMPY